MIGLFKVDKPNRKDVHFNMHKGGLHYHDTKICHINLVQTV